MITLIPNNYNTLDDLFSIHIYQEINKYYREMADLKSYKLECSCGIKGNCIKYGSYERKLIINDKTVTIKIQRVYCKHCKKTHAIMPIFIIPYEQKPLNYVLDLVMTYIDKKVSKADYELTRYLSIYNRWENRLRSIEITLSDGINKVIAFCASFFKMCFMQNKVRRNIKLNWVDYYAIPSPT